MKSALKVQDLLGDYRAATPDEILSAAHAIINQRFRRGTSISSVAASIDLFRQKLSLREQEVFAVLFLDNRHRVIAYEELFYGTIDGASVHPESWHRRRWHIMRRLSSWLTITLQVRLSQVTLIGVLRSV